MNQSEMFQIVWSADDVCLDFGIKTKKKRKPNHWSWETSKKCFKTAVTGMICLDRKSVV